MFHSAQPLHKIPVWTSSHLLQISFLLHIWLLLQMTNRYRNSACVLFAIWYLYFQHQIVKFCFSTWHMQHEHSTLFLHIRMGFLPFSPMLENLILHPPNVRWLSRLNDVIFNDVRENLWKCMQTNDVNGTFMNNCVNSYATVKV